MKASKQFNLCTQQRRRLVTHSLLNTSTGESTEGRQEWEEGPCAAPLFSDTERASGLCRSCASGWTHPKNFPIEGAK